MVVYMNNISLFSPRKNADPNKLIENKIKKVTIQSETRTKTAGVSVGIKRSTSSPAIPVLNLKCMEASECSLSKKRGASEGGATLTRTRGMDSSRRPTSPLMSPRAHPETLKGPTSPIPIPRTPHENSEKFDRIKRSTSKVYLAAFKNSSPPSQGESLSHSDSSEGSENSLGSSKSLSRSGEALFKTFEVSKSQEAVLPTSPRGNKNLGFDQVLKDILDRMRGFKLLYRDSSEFFCIMDRISISGDTIVDSLKGEKRAAAVAFQEAVNALANSKSKHKEVLSGYLGKAKFKDFLELAKELVPNLNHRYFWVGPEEGEESHKTKIIDGIRAIKQHATSRESNYSKITIKNHNHPEEIVTFSCNRSEENLQKFHRMWYEDFFDCLESHGYEGFPKTSMSVSEQANHLLDHLVLSETGKENTIISNPKREVIKAASICAWSCGNHYFSSCAKPLFAKNFRTSPQRSCNNTECHITIYGKNAFALEQIRYFEVYRAEDPKNPDNPRKAVDEEPLCRIALSWTQFYDPSKEPKHFGMLRYLHADFLPGKNAASLKELREIKACLEWERMDKEFLKEGSIPDSKMVKTETFQRAWDYTTI